MNQIKNADINKGALITTGKRYKYHDGAHAYMIKGVYSTYDIKTKKTIDCIVIKNPHCKGNFEDEEIDIETIKNQLGGLEYIKRINENYPNTGIIYMPMDYYYEWCDDYTICTPDYKTLSPITHHHFQLYQKLMELYNMNSSKYYFDIDDGRKYVKTNLISYENQESKLSIIKDLGLNVFETYSDNSNSYDLKIEASNETIININPFFGKKLETNYVIHKLFGKYEVLTLDELLKRKRKNIGELFIPNFEINEKSEFNNKYITRKLTLENLPNIISSTNPEELFDKLVEMLKKRNSEIQTIDDKNVRKKEEEEYKKLLDFLQQKFPEKYNKVSKFLTKNLKINEINKNSVQNSDVTTIFKGLNLRSENFISHGKKNDSTRHNYHFSNRENVYVIGGNYNYQSNYQEFYLDNYYMRTFPCRIKDCDCEFIFNKYFCFYNCYYSINGEPEKSTGGLVVTFEVIPGMHVKIRNYETFNFIVNGNKIFSIDFPINKTVAEFKEIVKQYGIELLSLYGFSRYSEIPKLMNDNDTFECVKGYEFNIDLSPYLTIVNINNSLNGIERFKANVKIINY